MKHDLLQRAVREGGYGERITAAGNKSQHDMMRCDGRMRCCEWRCIRVPLLHETGVYVRGGRMHLL
jgi:hypothetical protein